MASSHDATSPCDLLQGLVAGTSPIVCANLDGSASRLCDFSANRIYNKILDSDWFSACLMVKKSTRDHVGVRFELFVIGHL